MRKRILIGSIILVILGAAIVAATCLAKSHGSCRLSYKQPAASFENRFIIRKSEGKGGFDHVRNV